MKRRMQLCAILFALILLLCACAGRVEQLDNTDNAATTGSATETQKTNISSTDGQSASDDQTSEESFLENLISTNPWYGRALDCVFEKTEDIPAKFYFYNGVGANDQAKDDELAFILDAYKKKNPNTANADFAYNYMRLPVVKMNEALSVLGVRVEDIQIPEHWAYYDKTDAYYFWVSDAYGVPGKTVTKVEKVEDGLVALYWEKKDHWTCDEEQPIPGSVNPGSVKMVATLQQQPDGTYRVLSNLPQK